MNELIRNFGIDWRLLLAQAVNFLILLVILKKFAYRPILDILRKRKEKIEQGIAFAKEAEEKLNKSDLLREEVLKKANKEAFAIVSASEDLAKKRKEEIIAESNKKAEAVILDAKRQIEEEKIKMGEEIFGDAKELVKLGIARALGKMPSAERDEKLIEEALRELRMIKQ